MAPHDKRSSTRYDVELEIVMVRNGEETPATTVNLSLGGALMRAPTEPPLRVGERVEVAFRLPGLDAPLHAKADVRWVNEVDMRIVGIQFVTGFRAKETWALGRFLESHKPA